MSQLSHLNAQQQSAVRHVSSPLLVLAGAGSGKTGVITHKITWLMQDQGYGPKQIAALTFTNKAAKEMKSRVASMIGKKSVKGLTISTFHSLGQRILRAHAEDWGYRDGFTLLDPQDSVQVLRELLTNKGLYQEQYDELTRNCISKWKNQGLSPNDTRSLALASDTDAITKIAVDIFPDYQRYLAACNVIDLDDLIYQSVQLFKLREDVLMHWQQKLRYLLVDEYQDTNGLQYELVKLLIGKEKNLTVVGDDDQSIYSWRGAQPENLRHLQKDFPDLTVVKLEQNYRSTGRILKIANHLIEHNGRPFKKNLWSDLGYGDPIKVIAAKDDMEEADRVVASILDHRFRWNSAYGDFAILYRSNHQARVFEKKLREARIPYYLSGGISFFDRAEIRDCMAYLRILSNPSDDNAFMRVVNTPRRGVGPAGLEKLRALALENQCNLIEAIEIADTGRLLKLKTLAPLCEFSNLIAMARQKMETISVAEVLDFILDSVFYEEWLQGSSASVELAERRMANVVELKEWLNKIQGKGEERKSFIDVIANIVLMGVLDKSDDDPGNEVALMTLHAAKGLEFPQVTIVGVEEGFLPHHTSRDEGNVEEERRLFYVGITRARKNLTLSFCRSRRRYGEQIDCQPSEFLSELPELELDWQESGKVESTEGQAHLDVIRQLLS